MSNAAMNGPHGIPFAKPFLLSRKDTRLVMAAVVHKMAQLSSPNDRDNQLNWRLGHLTNFIHAARFHKADGTSCPIKDTLIGEFIADALRLYLSDSESFDSRVKPHLAVTMLATEYQTEDHPRTVHIELLIRDLEATIANTIAEVA